MDAKGVITVQLDHIIGTINPNIYGHFIEHLGRCIYPGIWVGEQSRASHVQGLRRDVVDALKRINLPVMRWPGGCFADAYHWIDGVGPPSQRPHRQNIWWGGEDSNEFGTDEFMRFCSSVGAKAYLCVNVGSGSPQEALSWLEYCTYARNSSYSQLRAANGHPQPYNVTFWGVGNENWGCGGSFDPSSYAEVYKRFATYLRQANPSIQLIACGHTTPNWNLRVMEALRGPRTMRLIDNLSIHYYFSGRRNPFGGDIKFTDEEYYNLLLDVQNLEYHIQQACHIVDSFSEQLKNIGLVIDEWGTWHPQATVDSGLYQQNTLRDAILAAVVLNLFNRYSRKIVMANLAQTVNVLQSLCLTKGDKTILTPTYHVFDLYQQHMGNDTLMVNVQSPTVKEASNTQSTRKLQPLHALDATASLGDEGTRLVITLVNQSLDDDLNTEIHLIHGSQEVEKVELSTLNATDVRAHNDFDSPSTIIPRVELGTINGKILHYTAPKHSVTRFTLTLK